MRPAAGQGSPANYITDLLTGRWKWKNVRDQKRRERGKTNGKYEKEENAHCTVK